MSTFARGLTVEAADGEAFRRAFVRLIGSIDDLHWRIRLTVAVATWMPCLLAGIDIWNVDLVLAGVMLQVVLQHMYAGRPLVLPLVVLDAYAAAGEKLETPLAECAECGYALPRSFAACPLCGGFVGVGAYASRRARRAACN